MKGFQFLNYFNLQLFVILYKNNAFPRKVSWTIVCFSDLCVFADLCLLLTCCVVLSGNRSRLDPVWEWWLDLKQILLITFHNFFYAQTWSRYIQHSALFVLNWWCHLHFESHSICHSMAYMIIQQIYILVFHLIILFIFFYFDVSDQTTDFSVKSNLACVVIFENKNISREKPWKTFTL